MFGLVVKPFLQVIHASFAAWAESGPPKNPFNTYSLPGFDLTQKPGQRYVPTAEADAGAGKVLIWEEGITGDVIFWNVTTEALTQSLVQGIEVSTEKLLPGKTSSSNQASLPGEPCRWRRQRVVSE